jgi:hypothetical protein
MKSIFNFLCYGTTSVVLTLILWNQLELCLNENNSLVIYIIDFFLALTASNWICSKLDK